MDSGERRLEAEKETNERTEVGRGRGTKVHKGRGKVEQAKRERESVT